MTLYFYQTVIVIILIEKCVFVVLWPLCITNVSIDTEKIHSMKIFSRSRISFIDELDAYVQCWHDKQRMIALTRHCTIDEVTLVTCFVGTLKSFVLFTIYKRRLVCRSCWHTHELNASDLHAIAYQIQNRLKHMLNIKTRVCLCIFVNQKLIHR
jgi:hypothetical protein